MENLVLLEMAKSVAKWSGFRYVVSFAFNIAKALYALVRFNIDSFSLSNIIRSELNFIKVSDFIVSAHVFGDIDFLNYIQEMIVILCRFVNQSNVLYLMHWPTLNQIKFPCFHLFCCVMNVEPQNNLSFSYRQR